MHTRSAALVVLLAHLAAPVLQAREWTPCERCPPECPMHARRLACHGGAVSCHGWGPGVGTHGCGKLSHPAVTYALRAILVRRGVTPALVRGPHWPPLGRPWRPRASPEPAPDPPEAPRAA
jgi:hypothetical protein